MSLKKATLIALIGLCLSLLLRVIHAIFPQIDGSPVAVQMMTFLGILVFASLFLFILYFYKQYLSEATDQSRKPTLFLMFTIGLILLLRLRGFLQVLPKLQIPVYKISPGLYGFLADNSIGHFSLIISGIYALSLLIFFNTLNVVFRRKESSSLQNATRWAVYGSILNFFLCTLNIVIFYFFQEAGWVQHFSQKFSIFILFLFLLASLTFLYFIWTFYKNLVSPH
jgi:hypothetical protein